MLVEYSVFTGPMIALAVLAGTLVIVSVIAIARSQKRKLSAGRETMRGRVGTVRTPLRPDGTVFVDGELWQATVDGPHIEAGSRVVVTDIVGLRLTVQKKEEKDD